MAIACKHLYGKTGQHEFLDLPKLMAGSDVIGLRQSEGALAAGMHSANRRACIDSKWVVGKIDVRSMHGYDFLRTTNYWKITPMPTAWTSVPEFPGKMHVITTHISVHRKPEYPDDLSALSHACRSPQMAHR